MNQSNRVCKMEGHDELPIFHVCTYFQCNQPKRWCCSQCNSLRIHNHNKPNNSHVMKIKELLSKLKSEAEKFKEILDGHKTMQLKFQKKYLKNVKKSIESQILNLTQQQTKFKQYLNNLALNNFEILDDIKLDEFLKINLQQFNQNQQLLPIDHIKQQLSIIEQSIKDQSNNKNENFNQIIDLKKRKYVTQQLDQTDNHYYGSSISKNEQYLKYGGNEQVLEIYDIKQKKIIKEINLDYDLYVCQFTQDSSKLYVGLERGYVQGYDVQDDFKEIYKQQIHQNHIYNIITIQNEYLITCSEDKSIIKTDIKSKQQILKFTDHTSCIIAIDYNDKDEIIVSGSEDKSIKLWNCRDQGIIINKEQSHIDDIRQIQSNNNFNILSLDCDGNLYKWKIDLTNKDLIKLQQFSDQNKIFNFYQVNQDQNLLLICNNYSKIINQKGRTINIIEHGGKDSYTYCDCRQLDNIKYIQIRADRKIILAIAED